jgi:hypothetical protein
MTDLGIARLAIGLLLPHMLIQWVARLLRVCNHARLYLPNVFKGYSF